MTTVISHLSALRAIRRARRAYSALPWDSVDSEQQAQALAGCIPNNDAIDFGALSILDAWNEDDSELLDLLVSNEDNRRPDKRLLQHISPLLFLKVQLCTSRPTSTQRLLP